MATPEPQLSAENGSPPINHPLTVADVITSLTKLVERDPKFANWAVHLLDMDGDYDGPERPHDGLLTHIETDAMSHEQGWVVSFMAWRNRDGRDGKTTNTWDHQPIPWPDETPLSDAREEPTHGNS